MRKFKLSNMRTAQVRSGLGSGSLGLHPNQKHHPKSVQVIPNDSIHKPSRTYKKGKGMRSLTSRETFETVRFKHARTDMAGHSRGKIPRKAEFLGEYSLDYNPFENSLGFVQEGAQIGGGDYDERSPVGLDYSVQPKFSIKKSGKKLGIVHHPEPYPTSLLGDDKPTKYKNLVRLK